jgi:hypothetical protein
LRGHADRVAEARTLRGLDALTGQAVAALRKEHPHAEVLLRENQSSREGDKKKRKRENQEAVRVQRQCGSRRWSTRWRRTWRREAR